MKRKHVPPLIFVLGLGLAVCVAIPAAVMLWGWDTSGMSNGARDSHEQLAGRLWMFGTIVPAALIYGGLMGMWLNRRKPSAGACARCGYVQRGWAGNTCPECGCEAGHVESDANRSSLRGA